MGPAEPTTERTPLLTAHHLNLNSSTGQTLTEYAFILAFIVLVVIVAVPLFGSATAQLYNDVMAGFGG